MNVYVCTYRQITPSLADLRKTTMDAPLGSLLRKFLDEYDGSFYDWGDDPSFFAAKHMLGDVRGATWGVCRRDVRGELEKGDVIVFFCGSRQKDKRSWHYHFIGFGIVADVVRDRKLLWTKQIYAPYRRFYNILTDSNGKQLESFYPYHEDWKFRVKAPYILFDSTKSAFNLHSPHIVAVWDGEGMRETWRADQRTQAIEHLLFVERNIERRLRTSNTGYAHAKLNLLSDGRRQRTGRPINDLLAALTPLI